MTSIITYGQMQGYYENFKKNPPADEAKRYREELNLVNNLLKRAGSSGSEQEVKQYQTRKNELVKKLTDMGYKVQID